VSRFQFLSVANCIPLPPPPPTHTHTHTPCCQPAGAQLPAAASHDAHCQALELALEAISCQTHAQCGTRTLPAAQPPKPHPHPQSPQTSHCVRSAITIGAPACLPCDAVSSTLPARFLFNIDQPNKECTYCFARNVVAWLKLLIQQKNR
jgi:hypothetical protein